MAIQRGEVELMSPAGSFEALMAAIQLGADSVYFGIEQLNMRARSSNNFTLQDLGEICRICAVHRVKTYLTLNTIVYDHDLNLMKGILDAALQHGVSAIIASDYAVFNYAKKIGIPTHVSTQANVTNIDTVEFYASHADVMVLSRELSLMQVESIVKEIKRRQITGPSGVLVGIEIFAHGALCMAVSGKCYLSLHTDFASANRGACIQNCRQSYIVTDKEKGIELEIDNEYIMSAKDLCTIDFLDQVLSSGVSVLKIEGRGRSPEYVATVTACYREAIEACKNGTFNPELVKDWKARLSTVFNRGFWDGYYLGRTLGEWSNEYGSKATKRKVYVGKGMKYFEQVKVGEFLLEAQSLTLNDEILITGPTTGVIQTKITELRVDGKPAEKVSKGELFSIPLDQKIRPSDKLYKMTGV